MKTKAQKQKEAAARADQVRRGEVEQGSQRSAADQLKRLDAKLGKGQGAKRERARLLKALLEH